MKSVSQQTHKLNEKPVGIFTGIFGCWHHDLSRPFTTKSGSYRACLNCGARKHFDPKTLKTFGRFYFQSPVAENLN